jgi:hypothetical protein
MFFKHKPSGNKDEMACLSSWQLLKNLGKLAGSLGNPISMIDAVLSHFHFRRPLHVEYRDGQLYLDSQVQALRGPEIADEASQVWAEIAREFAEEAEFLAERIEG